jgi:hypothetical protein
MSVPRELYLFFLTDKGGRSYSVENDIVKSSLTPTWLPEAPEGWVDTEVSFARSNVYFGINRSFVPPLKFPGDGARIIRHLFYTQKGVEQELYLLISKWNDQTGVYDPYYKGGIDLSKIDDQAATGVTVTVLESGLLQLFKANEKKVYEILCDGSRPEHVRVKLVGIKFHDIFHYNVFEFSAPATSSGGFSTNGIIYLNNEGDNIGVIHGDQTWNEYSSEADMLASNNYMYSVTASTQIRIKGKIKFQVTDNGLVFYQHKLYYGTSAVTLYPAGGIVVGTVVEYDFDETITLAPGDKLYSVYGATTLGDNATLNFSKTEISIEFDSQYQDTLCWALKPADLFKQLVNKATDGKYSSSSVLLDHFAHLVCTSGICLRNTTGVVPGNPDSPTVIKTSLVDFFTSFNSILNGALGVRKINSDPGEELFFERKQDVYDPSVITIDLGEVSDMGISVAQDLFFNLVKIGYPEQKYDEKQGQLEYNTTSNFSAPVTKIQNDLNLVSKYRSDSYGIEYTRFLSPGNQTANNKSDNDVFILNIDNSQQVVTATVGFSASGNLMLAPTTIPFVVGQQIQINGSATNNGTYTISGVANSFFFQVVALTGPALTDETDAVVTITFLSGAIYNLKRINYTSITGLVNEETAYNIEDLTPKRMLARHGGYIRGVLHNHPAAYLKFDTNDKNKELVTENPAGSFIMEKTDQLIGQLSTPLFYPYIIKFKTKVPLTFEQVMNGAANGHIRLKYNGKTIYCFPNEVSVKPTLNDAQEWQGLISPLTNLADLENLDIDGLQFITSMGYSLFIPHLCPVQFVPLGSTLPAQYHFKHMDVWWHSEQIQHYVQQNKYAAKWQTNDSIKLQCQTNGLGPVQVDLLDCSGKVLNTYSLDTVSDAAVISPMVLFEGNIPLSDLPEGYYYLLITAGTGETIAQVISEPLHVRDDHEETLLFEYTHSKNKQACIFTTGYNPSMRVEGWLDDFNPDASFATYVNQPADIELQNGIPYRTHKLNIGNKTGLPDWVADKVNRVMLLNQVSIDGEYFSRNSDAKMEKITSPGTPLKFWNLQIRPGKNRDGISVGTDGQLDDQLTVVYNINTKAFGDGAGSDNIVQVEKVD